ncbi:MAG: hypothetical protein H0X37_25125 [Herpetosiphonaceae bacterium]|nr:hypothetical protein [Herpetosiphonaceae bacterium]
MLAIKLHKQRRSVGLLALIIVLYLAISTMWSLTVPLGEGPDEAAHFDYALFLARSHRLPVQTARGGDVPGEGHQPPLAYWLLQPVVRWLPVSAQTLQVKTNPQFMWAGGSQINAYVHGGREAPPYSGQVLAWHLARGMGVLLGAVTVGLCWLTARLIAPARPELAPAAAALVAFNPQFIFQHALVSNDPLLIALSSLLLTGCVAAVTVGRHWRRQPGELLLATGLGLLLGLLLITKQSAIALAPLPFLALGLSGATRRQWVKLSLTTLVITLLISGWWYLRNDRTYGDPLGLQIFQQTFATGDFSVGSLANWRAGGWSLLRSSWGVFGWQTVTLAEGAYWIFLLVVLLGLIGLVRTLATPGWPGQARMMVVCGSAIGLVLLWTIAFAKTAGMVAWQGRFLFPAIVPLAIALAAGWASLWPRAAGLVTIPTGLLLVAVALPFGLLRPAYPVYARTRTQVQVGTLYGAFDQGWKRGAELRAATFPSTATTGASIPIKLLWYTAAPLDRPWTVFVHVVDSREVVVANTSEQPLAGRFPTDAWELNDWIEDPKRVDLTGVAPGRYEVRIGLYDPRTNQRLGVYDRKRRQLGDYLVVGTLTVQPPG